MTVYVVQYDSWLEKISVFSTLEKAKEDIIKYVKNYQHMEWHWNLEELQRTFEEVTAELFGFDSWEEGFMLCDYDQIDNYLGDFASIKKITMNENTWGI